MEKKSSYDESVPNDEYGVTNKKGKNDEQEPRKDQVEEDAEEIIKLIAKEG